MDMRRICDMIEMELDVIADKGFSTSNIETAYKLIDMYKDIKTVEEMENYNAGYDRAGYDRTMYDRAGYDRADYDRSDSYGRYSKAKYNYRHSRSAGNKMEVVNNLERYMGDLTDKLNDMLKDADTQEERDTINRYISKIHM